VGADANGGVAEAGVEDVGAVPPRGHPGCDDRTRSALPERAPANVLADFVTDPRAGDVASGAYAAERGFPLRPIVFEVVMKGHALAVGLSGPLQSRIGHQGRLTAIGPFPIDQAEDGGANEPDVALVGLQCRVGASAGDVAGRYAPPGRAMKRGPSRSSHDRQQGHNER